MIEAGDYRKMWGGFIYLYIYFREKEVWGNVVEEIEAKNRVVRSIKREAVVSN